MIAITKTAITSHDGATTPTTSRIQNETRDDVYMLFCIVNLIQFCLVL